MLTWRCVLDSGRAGAARAKGEGNPLQTLLVPVRDSVEAPSCRAVSLTLCNFVWPSSQLVRRVAPMTEGERERDAMRMSTMSAVARFQAPAVDNDTPMLGRREMRRMASGALVVDGNQVRACCRRP